MTTWADLAALFSSPLSPDDIAGGWTDTLRSRWQVQAVAFRDIGMRFQPSDASPLLTALAREGVRSGPIVEAITAAKTGFPGVGTTGAVDLAVKRMVARTRGLGFVGRAPTLRRELLDATIHVVNFQRVVSGVTGREPGFVVNLDVVHGALRRAWAATGHWRGRSTIRSAGIVGVATRLSVPGGEAWHEQWWHPGDEAEAEAAAEEAFGQLRTSGVSWLDRMSDPSTAIDELLLPRTALVAAALLVERPEDDRRASAAHLLRQMHRDLAPDLVEGMRDDLALRDFLLDRLADSEP